MHDNRYNIVRPDHTHNLLDRWHKRRRVWQWFYDSANPGWKTRGGAERALAKLRQQFPEEFRDARVE